MLTAFLGTARLGGLFGTARLGGLFGRARLGGLLQAGWIALVVFDLVAAGVVAMVLRRSHRALADAEATHRTTLETLAEGVVLYDLLPDRSLRVVLANPAARTLLGLDLEDLRHMADGTLVLDAVGADGGPLRARELPAGITARTGEPVDGMIWGMRRPGDLTISWFRSSSAAVLDGNGQVRAIAVSLIDVTDAQRHRQALERAHARFAALIEHGTDLIMVFGPGRHISYASPAFERILGIEPDEVRGTSVANLLHPDDRAGVMARLDALEALPGEAVTYECRVAHGNGTWRTLEVTTANRVDDPAVGGYVSAGRDVTERVLEAGRLAHRATHDPLTKLPNRDLLLERIGELTGPRRSRVAYAVAYIDLDNFKVVNDSFGHAAGDELLCQVAARLADVVRPGDTVARLGGDEFVVLAEGIDDRFDAAKLAERVRCELARPLLLGTHAVSVSASLGVALGRGSAVPEDLLAAADTALYRAKQAGRNRWELADTEETIGHSSDLRP